MGASCRVSARCSSAPRQPCRPCARASERCARVARALSFRPAERDARRRLNVGTASDLGRDHYPRLMARYGGASRPKTTGPLLRAPMCTAMAGCFPASARYSSARRRPCRPCARAPERCAPVARASTASGADARGRQRVRVTLRRPLSPVRVNRGLESRSAAPFAVKIMQRGEISGPPSRSSRRRPHARPARRVPRRIYNPPMERHSMRAPINRPLSCRDSTLEASSGRTLQWTQGWCFR
jgi:hypothetical protein